MKRQKFRTPLLLLGGLVLLALLLNGRGLAAAFHGWQLGLMALPRLEAQVRKHPRDLEARYHLARAYSRAERSGDATRELLAILQQDPTRADVLNDLGALYLLQERYTEALVALQGAITAEPKLAAAHANLGRLHLTMRMPYTAVRNLEQAERLAPADVNTLCDLGQAYQASLNFKSAEAACRRALARDPRSVPARIGLGRALISLARWDEAEEALEAARKLAPEHPTVLLVLGQVRMQRAATDAELEAARALFQRSAEGEPNEAETWYELGRVTLRLRRPETAVELLARALSLSPAHTGVLQQLGRALQAAGREGDSRRVTAQLRTVNLRNRETSRLEEHLQRNPNDWNAQARIAELYLQSGKPGLAAMVCRRVQQEDPGNPRLPALLAVLHRLQAPPQAAVVPAAAAEPEKRGTQP